MIHFITGNSGKLQEIQLLMPEVEGLDIDLVEIQHSDAKAVIEAKLAEAVKHHEGALMVEDTSLYVDSLNGLPGPLIKWFIKSIGTEGIVKIAAAMAGTADMTARAETLIGLRDESGKVVFFSGTIQGKIVEPRGEGGFGWDTIFQPDGHTKTFGEMTRDEKGQISMRKAAVAKLKSHLENTHA